MHLAGQFEDYIECVVDCLHSLHDMIILKVMIIVQHDRNGQKKYTLHMPTDLDMSFQVILLSLSFLNIETEASG